MLTVDVATNLLATALWEVAIVPLYRGARAVVRPRDARRGEIGATVAEAARELARMERGRTVAAETWAGFFEEREVQALVADIYKFRLGDWANLTEVKVAFRGLWKEFAERHGIDPTAVAIDDLFDR